MTAKSRHGAEKMPQSPQFHDAAKLLDLQQLGFKGHRKTAFSSLIPTLM